ATERLRVLFDDGVWTEYDRGLVSTDPLEFTDTKSYKARLKTSIETTGLKDAVIVASGRLDGIQTLVAAMEYEFIGGSIGVVVGCARIIAETIWKKLPEGYEVGEFLREEGILDAVVDRRQMKPLLASPLRFMGAVGQRAVEAVAAGPISPVAGDDSVPRVTT